MIILACGLSRSGKSTLISRAAVEQLGFIHVKASDVLHQQGRPIIDLTEDDIAENQKVLIRGLIATKLIEQRIILDGHLLIETVNGPQLVLDSYLTELPMAGILVIESLPDQLLKRGRPSDAGGAHDPDEIADLMLLERTQAHRVAKKINAAFRVIRSGDTEGFRTAVVEIGAIGQQTLGDR